MSVSKESACNAGDLGLIPGLGRCPGERNGNPLQYSCLENPLNRGGWPSTVHGGRKSRTLFALSFFFSYQKLPAETTRQRTVGTVVDIQELSGPQSTTTKKMATLVLSLEFYQQPAWALKEPLFQASQRAVAFSALMRPDFCWTRTWNNKWVLGCFVLFFAFVYRRTFITFLLNS